jgi:acyl carrier protein
MKGSLDENFKTALKRLIIEACDLADRIDVHEIDDQAPLFGRNSKLGLDSIDALQISIAIQQEYGITITDSKEMRRIMTSINTFADFIQPES